MDAYDHLNYGEEDTRQEATPDMLRFEQEHREQLTRDEMYWRERDSRENGERPAWECPYSTPSPTRYPTGPRAGTPGGPAPPLFNARLTTGQFPFLATGDPLMARYLLPIVTQEKPTPTPATPFTLGRLLMTPGAQRALVTAGIGPFGFLARHVVGDWGLVCPEDWALNNAARRDGDRILSAYPLHPDHPNGPRVWIITEADRSATTLLLPEEY